MKSFFFCFLAGFCIFTALISGAGELMLKTTERSTPDYWAKKVKRNTSGIFLTMTAYKQKGETCNPSSTRMILQHFGKNVKPSVLMKGGKEDGSFKTGAFLREKLEPLGFYILACDVRTPEKFQQTVKNAIDSGIPVRWLVDLRRAPESDVPARAKTAGPMYHARILNGYHPKKDKVLFADSWGAHNKKKAMSWRQAFNMTIGAEIIVPNDISEQTLKKILFPQQNASPRIPRKDSRAR